MGCSDGNMTYLKGILYWRTGQLSVKFAIKTIKAPEKLNQKTLTTTPVNWQPNVNNIKRKFPDQGSLSPGPSKNYCTSQ